MNEQVKQLLQQINLDSERDRQDSQEKRLSMFLDDYSDEVYELLKKQFHKDNITRLFPMLATYYNLFKKIINLKSVIYKNEAQRSWYKRDGKNTDDNYAEMIGNTNIDTVSQLCNKLTNVNNTSFVRVLSDNGKIRYDNVPSELISITQNPDNPTQINSLLHRVTMTDSFQGMDETFNRNNVYHKQTSSYTYKYFYWDFEKYIILDNDMNITQEIDNPYKDKNGQGIIPYVIFQNIPSISGSIWNETANSDLYNGTLQVNVFQTYFSNLIKQASYKQPWITGLMKDDLSSLSNKVSDALQPIVLTNENAKIGTFELSADIAQVSNAIHDIIAEIADNHGVSFSSSTTSAQKQSGLALSIEQSALDDLREEQIPLYRQAEKELAQKTILIANKDLQSNIDVEGQFSIDFIEDSISVSADDEIKRAQFYLSKNIKSVVDLYLATDPDCPDETEALKRIEANKKLNEELTDSLQFMPEVEVETPEI